MRLFILSFFILNAALKGFCESPAKIQIKAYDRYKEGENTLNYGISVTDSNFTLTDYLTYSTDLEKTVQSNRTGIKVKGCLYEMPFTIFTGQLSYSQSVKRLENPASSVTSSPFYTAKTRYPSLSPSLPGITSSKKSHSTAFQLNPHFKRSGINLEGAAFEDGTILACSGFDHDISDRVKVLWGITAGQFYIENSSTLLNKTNAAFKSGWYKAFVFDSSFTLPFLTQNLSLGMQESPYDTPFIWISEETMIKTDLFRLRLYFFAVPSSKDTPFSVPLMSTKGAVIRTQEIQGINPQLFLYCDNHFIHELDFALDVSQSWKESYSYTPQDLHILKLLASMKAKNDLVSFTLTQSVSDIILSGDEDSSHDFSDCKYETKAALKNYLDAMTASLNGSCTFEREKNKKRSLKETYTFSLYAHPAEHREVTAGWNMNITLRDNERIKEYQTFSIGLKYSKSLLQKSLKCIVQIPF